MRCALPAQWLPNCATNAVGWTITWLLLLFAGGGGGGGGCCLLWTVVGPHLYRLPAQGKKGQGLCSPMPTPRLGEAPP